MCVYVLEVYIYIYNVNLYTMKTECSISANSEVYSYSHYREVSMYLGDRQMFIKVSQKCFIV